MHQVVALQKLNEIGFKIADQRAYLGTYFQNSRKSL
jgi:hypothetical protein